MTDEAGAAGAATESIAQYQPRNGADDGVVQFEPNVDHTQETARNSLDRAFAALDVETSDGTEQARDEYGQVKDAAIEYCSPCDHSWRNRRCHNGDILAGVRGLCCQDAFPLHGRSR